MIQFYRNNSYTNIQLVRAATSQDLISFWRPDEEIMAKARARMLVCGTPRVYSNYSDPTNPISGEQVLLAVIQDPDSPFNGQTVLVQRQELREDQPGELAPVLQAIGANKIVPIPGF